uniref:Uncharacterized protein n=1 Tax=Arundo donax TaxID=35708 RepID=A0A0A9ESY5_ARUDO
MMYYVSPCRYLSHLLSG